MWEVGIFIYKNNKGSTLVECLLSFSIFTACIILSISLLRGLWDQYHKDYDTYKKYIILQEGD